MSRSFVPTVIVGDKGLTRARDAVLQSGHDQVPRVAPARRLPTLSCVVPCHNEAGNLALLLPLLSATLDECSLAWEIILVDDGSRDDTAALLAEWAEQPGYRAIILSRNFGKEAALTAGLEAAAGEVTVMIDADLQHPPAMIKTFVQRWQEGADVVYAVRADRSDETLFKRAGTRAFYKLLNTADRFEVPANAGDFRLMDRKVVEALMSLPERNRFMKGLYAWVGFNTVAVAYVPNERATGVSNFSALRLLRLSFDGLTAFTNLPLRAVSATGFVLAIAAFLYGLWETVSYFIYGNEVSGWTTIEVSLMLFAGIQLLSVGIVGEYVGRIFEEVKARPLYVISKESGQGLKATSS